MPKAKSRTKNPAKEEALTDLPSQRYEIEHCKSWSVYKRHALRIKELLTSLTPDIPIYINNTKPRSKSFEVTYYSGDVSIVLWTGVKIPPPRKNKFVSDERMGELVKELLPDLLPVSDEKENKDESKDELVVASEENEITESKDGEIIV